MTSFYLLFLSVIAVITLLAVPSQCQPGVDVGQSGSNNNQGFGNLLFPDPSIIRGQMSNLPLPPGMTERNDAANNNNNNPNFNPAMMDGNQAGPYQQQPQGYQQQAYQQQPYQQQPYQQQPYPQGFQQQAYPFPSPDTPAAAAGGVPNMGYPNPNPAYPNSPSEQPNMYQGYPGAAMDPNLNTMAQQQQQAPSTMPMYQGYPNAGPGMDPPPTATANSPNMPLYPTYAGAAATGPNFPNTPMYQGGYNPNAPMNPNINMPMYQGQQPQPQGMPTMFIEADTDAEAEADTEAAADADADADGNADAADVDGSTSNPQHAVPAAQATLADFGEDFDTLQFGGPGFQGGYGGGYEGGYGGGYGGYQGGKKQQGFQNGGGQPQINNKVTINKFNGGDGGLGAQNGNGITTQKKPDIQGQTITTYAKPITKQQIQKETQTVPVKKTKTRTQYKTRYTQVKVPKQITRKTVQPIITQPVIRRTIVKQPIITPVVQTQEIIKPQYNIVPQIQKTTVPQYSTAKPIVKTTTVQGKPQYNKPVYTTLPPIKKQGQNGQNGQYDGQNGQNGQFGQNGKGGIQQ